VWYYSGTGFFVAQEEIAVKKRFGTSTGLLLDFFELTFAEGGY